MWKGLILTFVISLLIAIPMLYLYGLPMTEYIRHSDFEPIPTGSDNVLELYRYYSDLERYPTSDYVVYVFDERDDVYLNNLVQGIVSGVEDDVERVNRIADYVQRIPYVEDDEEYPQFPIETIINNGGDCEDKAILGASLLELLGYNVTLIRLENHMAVGINLTQGFEFLEVTDEGWKLGDNEPSNPFVEYHLISDRPLVFHEWANMTIYTNIRLNKFIKGEVLVYNLGRAEANVTLKVLDVEYDLTIPKQNKVEVSFLKNVKEKKIKTELYLDASLVEMKENES